MTKYRIELNVALSQYLSTIIDLNTNFKLYNATKALREMYHPAILEAASKAAETAEIGIEKAYKDYIDRLERYYTLTGSKVDDNDIKLLNPAIFHLEQDEFDKLWEKHSGNYTMEAALRSYAESTGLLFDSGVPTKKEKARLADEVKHAALNDVRRNTVYELIPWCIEMKGDLYRQAEQLTE